MKHFAFYAVIFSFALTTSFSVATAHRYSSSYQTDSAGTTDAQRQTLRTDWQSGGLQQKISTLDSVANPSVYMPVLFGVGVKDISPNFGDPRDNGTRTHEGEDIMAIKGTPIVSPTPAVVLRTGTGGSEGIYVYTANPGGETFVYYHLDRVGEGVVPGLLLSQGSLIGYVGNTGNAVGGPAHLHFEIHNNSGTPTDPFPRLTSEFTLEQKISYLTTILTQTADPVALSRFLVTNFRGTFLTALTTIILPMPILDALASIPATPVVTGSGNVLSAGNLDLGSSGAAVIALQKYLIQANSGTAATRLASAGATGYFGLITKAALVEYQVLHGISPASGYYGTVTRAFVLAHPLSAVAPTGSTVVGSGAPLTRNLSLGSSGEDVRTLQRLLNTLGFLISLTGAGSLGNESIYFGPATQSAVIKFQTAYSISPATGYVGPLTRAALAL